MSTVGELETHEPSEGSDLPSHEGEPDGDVPPEGEPDISGEIVEEAPAPSGAGSEPLSASGVLEPERAG